MPLCLNAARTRRRGALPPAPTRPGPCAKAAPARRDSLPSLLPGYPQAGDRCKPRPETSVRRFRAARKLCRPAATKRAARMGRPARSTEMVRLGMERRPVPTRVYDPRGCPQATAPLTVPTPLSNITLDTGPPPFNLVAVARRWCHTPDICQSHCSARSQQIAHGDPKGHKGQWKQTDPDHPAGKCQRNPQRRDRSLTSNGTGSPPRRG